MEVLPHTSAFASAPPRWHGLGFRDVHAEVFDVLHGGPKRGRGRVTSVSKCACFFRRNVTGGVVVDAEATVLMRGDPQSSGYET